MKEELNLSSLRTRKARARHFFSHGTDKLLGLLFGFLALGGLYCILFADLVRIGYGLLAFATAILILLFWYVYDLKKLPPRLPATSLDDIMEAELLATIKQYNQPLHPRAALQLAIKHVEASFIGNHLLLFADTISAGLSTSEQDMAPIWKQAVTLADQRQTPELHSGTLLVAILLTTPEGQIFMTQNKLQPGDVLEVLGWLERQLHYIEEPKPNFGGIGRDWATGFTPTLERFSQNMSQVVQAHGGLAHYSSHSEVLDGMINSLERGNGVALVGPEGSGKTTLIYGLAERLLTGRRTTLKHYQVVSLNASLILSQNQSQLENLILTLFGEAINSGNMIVFLDDAQLFFSQGTGAFDMSQVLLPILKNRNLKIIAAFTSADWQRLQAERSALASSFASVTLAETNQQDTYKTIEDTTLLFEAQNHVLIAYEAIREAYRVSGQYNQDKAYPGKAIDLLEQSLPYADHKVITAAAVQMAIEKTRGVKVSAAAAPEASMLLNLEDRIHQRMINQTRAVTVIASALRRGRAGVSNPKRPVGSFLFLGPTGVGKTELARSLAAVYFGDENQMIRLDMSEYQRAEDVTRLLVAGGQQQKSLLLAIREQPFSVVLLDEIEKAHPNILNLLLQMLDEGQLTDATGRSASFRSSIIIATSNAGANDIVSRIKESGNLDNFERPLIDKLIAAGQFKPELVNRFDEVVLFRPLGEKELGQVAQIMLASVNKTLANQQISVQLTPAALNEIVHQGYDPEFGARPMRRIIQKTVENAVAVKILRGETTPGSVITLDLPDVTSDTSKS